MKKIEELNLPSNFKYTRNHEWAMVQEDYTIKGGVTDYAQDQLGEIVYVELPEVGTYFERNEIVSTLESVKAVVEMYTPISGEIVAVNNELENNPALINTDPYYAGWIIEIKTQDTNQMDELMDNKAYKEMLEGEE